MPDSERLTLPGILSLFTSFSKTGFGRRALD